jgi:hypothetical protein
VELGRNFKTAVDIETAVNGNEAVDGSVGFHDEVFLMKISESDSKDLSDEL